MQTVCAPDGEDTLQVAICSDGMAIMGDQATTSTAMSQAPCVQDWGLEVSMAAMLVAAFLAQNVMSLLLVVFIAAGMTCAQQRRR